jgi:hypothetical protein
VTVEELLGRPLTFLWDFFLSGDNFINIFYNLKIHNANKNVINRKKFTHKLALVALSMSGFYDDLIIKLLLKKSFLYLQLLLVLIEGVEKPSHVPKITKPAGKAKHRPKVSI